MNGDILFRGEFRVTATDPDTGEITHDTGNIKNTVTKGGVQMILCGIAGGIANIDAGITNEVTGYDETKFVQYIGVGAATNAPATPTDWYDNTDVVTPLADEAAVNSIAPYLTSAVMRATYNDTDGSYVQFKAAFAALGAITLTWCALLGDTGGDFTIAGSNFTGFVPGAATVEVTYTIFLTQATPP